MCGKHGAPGLCGPVRDGVKPRYCTEAHLRMALAKTIGGLTRRELSHPLDCFCQQLRSPCLCLLAIGISWVWQLPERSEPIVRIRDLQAVLRRTRRYTVFPLFCIVQSMLSGACALAMAIRGKTVYRGEPTSNACVHSVSGGRPRTRRVIRPVLESTLDLLATRRPRTGAALVCRQEACCVLEGGAPHPAPQVPCLPSSWLRAQRNPRESCHRAAPSYF